MTVVTPKEIIEAYDALVDRAIAAVQGAPYRRIVDPCEYARVAINGDAARLIWADADLSYGECSLEKQDFTFPSYLLSMPDVEFEAWKADQRAIYDAAQRQKEENSERQTREAEIAQLAILKAKYETGTAE